MKTRNRHCGISLVELIITVAIAALALTLGVPAFTGVQTTMQRAQASMELIASFSLARSEAARRGVSVTICPPTNQGDRCNTEQSPPWGAGWIVFTDLDENSVVDEGTDELIHTARFPQSAFSITTRSEIPGAVSEIAQGVHFRGSGFPNATGRYLYCDRSESRELALSYVGRLEQVSSGAGCL
jgi:type IV fimbrial biogenesis protein FimT